MEPIAETNAETDATFVNQLDEFIVRYRPALEALAVAKTYEQFSISRQELQEAFADLSAEEIEEMIPQSVQDIRHEQSD